MESQLLPWRWTEDSTNTGWKARALVLWKQVSLDWLTGVRCARERGRPEQTCSRTHISQTDKGEADRKGNTKTGWEKEGKLQISTDLSTNSSWSWTFGVYSSPDFTTSTCSSNAFVFVPYPANSTYPVNTARSDFKVVDINLNSGRSES